MSSIDFPEAVSKEATAALNEGLRALQDALRTPELETALEKGLPAGFVEAMERWWAAYDRYTSVVSEALEVTCTRGCHFCCLDNPTGVSGVELLWVLRSLPEDLDGAAAEPAARFEGAIEQWGSVEQAQRLVKANLDPCMYLQDGQCRVYAGRPIACRMFFSITQPYRCDPAFPGEATNPKLEPPQVLKELLKAISHRLGLSGLPGDLRRGMAALEADETLRRPGSPRRPG